MFSQRILAMLAIMFSLGVVSSGVGAAFAESAAPNAPLSIEELKQEFFGTRMYGVQVGIGQSFMECIEPDGRAIFEMGGYVSEGYLEISADAHACFTYESGTYCYRVQRAPKGYMIRAVGFRAVFHVTKVERGIRSCTADDLIG